MRKEIARYLMSQPQQTTHLLENLKSCLHLDSSYNRTEDMNERVNKWFSDCIGSLFYRPNHNALVLVGPQAIGKTEFFRKLLPDGKWFTDIRQPYSKIPDVSNYFLVDMSDFPVDLVKQIVSTEGFSVTQGDYPTASKRCASVCYTTNYIRREFSDARRSIVVYLKEIDWVGFNSIDKYNLWNEIFWNWCANNKITLTELNWRFGL